MKKRYYAYPNLSKSQASIVVVLSVLVFYVVLLYFSRSRKVHSHSFGNYLKLCSYANEDHLSSFVWSHRAHYDDYKNIGGNNKKGGGDGIDGSAQSLEALLDELIIKFDIDISVYHFKDKSATFLVVHPTALLEYKNSFVNKAEEDIEEKIRKRFISITSFLNIIANHSNIKSLLQTNTNSHSNINYQPMVTIEPKFESLKLVEALLQDVKSSFFPSSQTAIIVTDPKQFSEVEKLHQSNAGAVSTNVAVIAVGFRSLPKKKDDFVWEMAVGAALPSFTSSSSNNFNNKSNDSNNLLFRQVLMVDVKLLLQSASVISPHDGDNTIVLSWLIDDKLALFTALENHKVDGVVSNRPVEMLQILQEKYRNVCK